MKIKICNWNQLNNVQRMKLLEIAASQNWMGRN